MKNLKLKYLLKKSNDKINSEIKVLRNTKSLKGGGLKDCPDVGCSSAYCCTLDHCATNDCGIFDCD